MAVEPKTEDRNLLDSRWTLRERRNSIVKSDFDEHALAYSESNAGMRVYGELPIRWGFIINGGALLVFPTIVSTLGIELVDSARAAFMFFALGILCAALGSYFAWQNFYQNQSITRNSYHQLKIESWSLAAEGLSDELNEWAKEQAEPYKSEIEDINTKLDKSFRFGQLFPVLSYVFFICGCVVLAFNENVLELTQAISRAGG